jgi:hypothetical protein
LYRQRNALSDVIERHPEWGDGEVATACAEVRIVEDQILAAEPRSVSDIGIQIRCLRESLDGAYRDKDDALHELERLVVRCDRLAGAETPLLALWKEHVELVKRINVGVATEVDRDRCDRIEAQIDEARPTDVGGIAVQSEWLTYCLEIGISERDEVMVRGLAQRLVALAGIELPARPHA